MEEIISILQKYFGHCRDIICRHPRIMESFELEGIFLWSCSPTVLCRNLQLSNRNHCWLCCHCTLRELQSNGHRVIPSIRLPGWTSLPENTMLCSTMQSRNRENSVPRLDCLPLGMPLHEMGFFLPPRICLTHLCC